MIAFRPCFRSFFVVPCVVAVLSLGACGLLEEEKPPVAEQNAALPPKMEEPTVVDSSTGQSPRPLEKRHSLVQFPGSGGAPIETMPPPPIAAGQIRVAILLPLSGRNAQLGQSMLNAAQLALFDLSDQRFELLPYDTGGTPQGAAMASRYAIADGSSIILGPLLASSVQAASPAAWTAKIPVVAFSSDREVAGDDVYVIGFTPATEVKRVISYAQSQGLRRIAALAPNNEYGQRVVTALEQAVVADGGVVAAKAFYDPRIADFDAAIRQIAGPEGAARAAAAAAAAEAGGGVEDGATAVETAPDAAPGPDLPFDAVVIADGGKRLQAMAAHLPLHGIEPTQIRVLGTGAWDEPGIGSEPSLVGGWYAAPPPNLRSMFERQYSETYNAKPHRLATLAYDATALAVILGRQGGDMAYTAERLTDQKGFMGRDGLFRMGPDGVVERELAVMEVTREGAKVISEPRTSFPPATQQYGY